MTRINADLCNIKIRENQHNPLHPFYPFSGADLSRQGLLKNIIKRLKFHLTFCLSFITIKP